MEQTFIPRLPLADAGIPMIALTLPGMLALLLPIICIEAWLCRRWLGLATWPAIKSNAVANLASTVLGVPTAWVLAFAFEFLVLGIISDIPSFQRWNSPIAHVIGVLLGSAWLVPDEKSAYWMIPLATITLLVPAFFASVTIETFVMRRMLGVSEDDTRAQSRLQVAVRNANLVTYGLLAAGTSIWLLFSLIRHQAKSG